LISKAKIKGPFKPDITLVFASKMDFNNWQKRTYAIPLATTQLGGEFWLVQGRIVEVVIEPPKPKKFAGSVVVG